MTEKPTDTQETEQSQEDLAKQYLDYFLKTACGESDDSQAVPDAIIKATTESLLLLHSGELASNSQASDPRDKAINSINGQKAGLPKSRIEVTDIVDGPQNRFDEAVIRKRGRRATYSRIDGFRQDALKDSSGLNKVMTVTDQGKIIAGVELFRQDEEAMFIVGDYLQARDFLDRMQWPAKNTLEYKASQKYWRGCVVAAARYADPSILSIVVEDALGKAKDRLGFMTEQIQKIDRTVGGRAIKAILNDPESQLKPELEISAEISQAEPETDTLIKFPIPQDVKLGLISKYAHKAALVETQVQQGIPRHLAELRVFGSPAIYDEGIIVGVEKKTEQPTTEAIVKASIRSRPSPANNSGVRRLAGYDQEDDPSNPWHY